MAIAVGLGIIWLILALCIPNGMVWVAVIGATVLLLVTAIVFFIASGNELVAGQGWAIILGIVCLVFMLLMLFYAFFHSTQLKLCAAFLELGANCIKENLIILLYIPLFVAITFVFGILTVFEYLAFASAGEPTLSSDNIFITNQRGFVLTFLLVIQTIWGLSFFRDCCNTFPT